MSRALLLAILGLLIGVGDVASIDPPDSPWTAIVSVDAGDLDSPLDGAVDIDPTRKLR